MFLDGWVLAVFGLAWDGYKVVLKSLDQSGLVHMVTEISITTVTIAVIS